MPTNIIVGLSNDTIGVNNYDIYVNDCIGELVYVTTLTYSQFPYTFDIEQYLPNYAGCYNYYVSGDTGCICDGNYSIIPPSPTPTNTQTPSLTPTNTVTPTITVTNTLTPTNTATTTLTPTNTLTPTLTPTITRTLTPTPTITPSPPCICYENISVTLSCDTTQGQDCPSYVILNYTECDNTEVSVQLNYGSTLIITACTILNSVVMSNLVPTLDAELVVSIQNSTCCANPPLSPTPTQTVTPTNTQTPTITPTVTPTPLTFAVTISGCCIENTLSTTFSFPSAVSVGNSFYWTGNQQNPAQCYVITNVIAVGDVFSQPVATISELFDQCSGCTTVNVCPSPTPTVTPTVTPTPTVTSTVTFTPTMTSTVTPTPTQNLIYARVSPCCPDLYPPDTNVSISIPASSYSLPAIVVADGNCFTLGYQIPQPYTNNVVFESVFSTEASGCTDCVLVHPCPVPPEPDVPSQTPTNTPTPTPLTYFKLTPCCDYDPAITINQTVAASAFNFINNRIYILDGVAYTVAGPLNGSSPYVPTTIYGPYNNCSLALNAPVPQFSCYTPPAPTPSATPACDCRRYVSVSYTCDELDQSSFCAPSIDFTYIDCETLEQVQATIELYNYKVLQDCVIFDSVQPVNQLNPAELFLVEVGQSECCGSAPQSNDLIWEIRNCLTGLVSTMAGPASLTNGNTVRTTDLQCWLVMNLSNQNTYQYVYLSTQTSCNDCLS